LYGTTISSSKVSVDSYWIMFIVLTIMLISSCFLLVILAVSCFMFYLCTYIHTYIRPFCGPLDFVWDYPGELIPKPIWILLKQEMVRGTGISWPICKSAPRPRQITMPAPHHSVFTGRMPFLSPIQQHQSMKARFNYVYYFNP